MKLDSVNRFIDLFYYAIYGRAAETDYERLSMVCGLLLAIGIVLLIGRCINRAVDQLADWYSTEFEKPKRKSKEDQPVEYSPGWINPALLEPEDGDIMYVDFPDEEARLK